MQKSKSEQLKSVLKHLLWVVNLVSKFMPANIKLLMVAFSTIAGGLVALLDSCDQTKNPPAPIPTATATETQAPTPTPSPKPTRPPLPEIRSRSMVKVGETFQVQLCNVPNKHNVSLYADQWRLGYFGFGKTCMSLNVALNTKGTRKLIATDGEGLRVTADVIVQ